MPSLGNCATKEVDNSDHNCQYCFDFPFRHSFKSGAGIQNVADQSVNCRLDKFRLWYCKIVPASGKRKGPILTKLSNASVPIITKCVQKRFW